MEKNRKVFTFTLVLLFLVLTACIVSPAHAQEEPKTVKIGTFQLKGFFEKDSFGNYTGYAVDYIENIAEYAGWNIEYVEADSWESTLKAFEAGKTDIVAPCQITTDRLNNYSFPAYPMGTEYGSILTLNTNEDLVYEDFSSFSDISLGCVPTLVFYQDFLTYAQENHFKTNITFYKDTPTLIDALNNGKVDAIVANLMVKQENMKLLGQFGASSYYFMLHRQDTELLNEMNDAINSINNSNPGYQLNLENKYFKFLSQIPISKQEQDYVNKLQTLTVGYVDGYAPVSYTDSKNVPAGITIDILKDISKTAGIQFQYKELPTGEITYDYLREHKIDLVANIELNASNIREENLLLTDPYLSAKKVFVMKNGEEYDESKHYLLALTSNSTAFAQVILREHPNLEVCFFNTVEECFQAVRTGNADLVLQNQYVIEPILSKPIYQNMSIVPLLDIEDNLCLSVVSGENENGEILDKRLVSILNKAIRQIDEDEVSGLVIKEMVQNQYEYSIGDFIYLYRGWLVAFSFLLICAVFFVYNVRRARKKNAALIVESERKFRHITNNINGGVVMLEVDKDYKIIYANDGFLSLIGYERNEYEEKGKKSYLCYVHPEEKTQFIEMVNRHCTDQKGSKLSTELKIQTKSGRYTPILFNGTFVTESTNGRVIYGVIMDISVQAKLLDELQISQNRYEKLMEQTGDIIFDINVKEKRITVSHQFEDKFGWSFPGTLNVFDKKHMLDNLKLDEKDVIKLMRATDKVLTKKESVTCEIRIKKPDNTPVWCEVFQFPMLNQNGEVTIIVGRIVDIDEEIRERKKLQDASKKDTLTGLYTKTTFNELCSKYLLENPDKESAVIFMDLDHFKSVNDTLGHMTGDQAIIDAAGKLQLIFSNLDIISRFGGDEFCILVKDIPKETLIDKLEWMLEKMTETYSDLEGNSVSITCSIGVVCTKDCGNDITELLECADKALYLAKDAGRGRYVFYNL